MLKEQLTASVGEIDNRISELEQLINSHEAYKQELIKLVGRKEMAIFTLNTIEANESINTSEQESPESDGAEATDTGS